MDQDLSNPPSNQLPSGVTEDQLLAAVGVSGYPLQTVVANLLRPFLPNLREEWSYVDRDSGELRSLDLVATRFLHEFDEDTRVRPQLDVLIECKRSDLPYVFFLAVAKPWLHHYPSIIGLRSDDLVLSTDDDPSTWTLSIQSVLGLDGDVFVATPPVSNTLSKAVWRKGGELELSGSDAYNSVVMPLVKAMAHFAEAEAPASTHLYFDAHLTLMVAVIDAPMVTVDLSGAEPKGKLAPWVRVVRHEYDRATEWWKRDRNWVVDFVHKDFVTAYFSEHVLPFAEKFAALAIKHDRCLAEGTGFVTGLGEDRAHAGLESRLSPRRMASRIARGKAVFSKLLARRRNVSKD